MILNSSIIPNAFSLSGILLGVTCTTLLLILLTYGKSKLHKIWFLFNVAVAIWGYCAYFIGKAPTEFAALFLWKLAFVGVLFIPVFFYHFACLFCRVNREKFIIFIYLQGFFFLAFNCVTNQYVVKVQLLWDSVFYLKSEGVLFPISFGIWLSLVVMGYYELIRNFYKFNDSQRNQALYLSLGFFIGFLGGTTNFFPMFDMKIYPYGNFTVSIYCIIVTYAILRHRLLDIGIVITRTGIFIAVYSMVLGIPFALAFGLQEKLFTLVGENWWIIPLIISTILATSGPFIYLYIQHCAEDRLLQEQRRYQSTLRQASTGMGRIKDLRRLVNLIVHIVTRTVRLEYSCVYLLDSVEKKYYLGGSRFHQRKISLPTQIRMDDALIKCLTQIHEPIVLEEISQRVRDYYDKKLVGVEDSLRKISAEVVVPSFVEQRLVGILVLGKKNSGKLYSQDDLAVFSILANQAALAIENAQFYEDMKKTHAQLLKTEKMATIGTMADGLSHQINNRLHAMGFIAGDMLDTVKLKRTDLSSPEAQEILMEFENGLNKILDNVKRGGEIVEGLLKYTRKGDQGFEDIDLDQLISASLEMAQFKIKLNEISFVRNYSKDTPLMRGNFTQLQEVFFNLIDNAYDAMMQRKAEGGEPQYRPELRVSAEKTGKYLNVIVQDNGIGVKNEDSEKMFTPFFTTKFAASKKGTGLGLYVMKKLVEDNHRGRIMFNSEHMMGTVFTIQLPLAQGSPRDH